MSASWRRLECSPPDARLRHGDVFPSANPLVGIYIDDLLILLLVPLSEIDGLVNRPEGLGLATCRASRSARLGPHRLLEAAPLERGALIAEGLERRQARARAACVAREVLERCGCSSTGNNSASGRGRK